MANRKFHDVRSPQPETVIHGVSFVTASDSSVSSQTEKSHVTVTKPAGTGIYRLTFKDAYPAVMFSKATIVKAAGTYDGDAMVVAITNAGTSTPLVIDLQCRKSSDGTAQDPGAATFLVAAMLRNSQVAV